MPMIDSSSMGNRLVRPRGVIAGPPTPRNSACGSSCRSPAISAAPNWSPEAAPAIRNNACCAALFAAKSWVLGPTRKGQPFQASPPAAHRNRPASCARRTISGRSSRITCPAAQQCRQVPPIRPDPPCRAQGRQVDAQILSWLRRLVEDTAGAFGIGAQVGMARGEIQHRGSARQRFQCQTQALRDDRPLGPGPAARLGQIRAARPASLRSAIGRLSGKDAFRPDKISAISLTEQTVGHSLRKCRGPFAVPRHRPTAWRSGCGGQAARSAGRTPRGPAAAGGSRRQRPRGHPIGMQIIQKRHQAFQLERRGGQAVRGKAWQGEDQRIVQAGGNGRG